jgi:PAS domain S-box-containing protein
VTAAEALIQTALLGEAVDAGPALVFVADEDMRYIAVNEFACQTLGYARDELLELRVSDVAREAGASSQYDELLLEGFRHGTSILTRKDGSTVEFGYRASRTRVAGLYLFVSVGFAADS